MSPKGRTTTCDQYLALKEGRQEEPGRTRTTRVCNLTELQTGQLLNLTIATRKARKPKKDKRGKDKNKERGNGKQETF